MSYSQKKKNLAAKGMPDPVVKKNVTKGDKSAELYAKNGGKMDVNMGKMDKGHIHPSLRRK